MPGFPFQGYKPDRSADMGLRRDAVRNVCRI